MDAGLLAQTTVRTALTLRFDPDSAARVTANQSFRADIGLDLRGALNPLLQPHGAWLLWVCGNRYRPRAVTSKTPTIAQAYGAEAPITAFDPPARSTVALIARNGVGGRGAGRSKHLKRREPSLYGVRAH
jgi:urea transport system permease protein